MQFDSFLDNPLTDNPRYSRERKIRFGYDQAGRLTRLDAAVFGAEISATTAACGALEMSLGRTGGAVGEGRGATIGSNAALQHYQQLVGSKYRVLQDRVGKEAALMTTVFGSSIQKFTTELTKTNAAARMEELDVLLDNHKAAVGDDIVTAIADAATAYTGKRTVQRAALATAETAYLGDQAAETALDQQLWLNACRVVIAYPSASDTDTARRRAAADYSLLLRPAAQGPEKVSGPVAAQAVVTVFVPDGLDVLLATTSLTLHNTGTTELRFGLATATDFDKSTARALAPGEQLTCTAADLGDPATHPYLNVYNPTDEAGAYEAVIG